MAKQVAVTGATGFLGQAVGVALRTAGYEVIDLPVNLLKEHDTEYAIAALGADVPVVHLAYPGGDGIADAVKHPATIALNLMRMDLNIIQACARHRVPKLVCIGSVCAYPSLTPVPTQETMLWNGYPEPVNASYGIVKRTQLALLQACRDEFKLEGVHLILPNLYGPGDKTSHVVPALIRKIRVAKYRQEPWTVWGHPEVTRSFLFITDAAIGIVKALERYNDRAPLNLVRAGETSMGELVAALEHLYDYPGHAVFDSAQPAGHQRRNFSPIAMLQALNWRPPTRFPEGLARTVAWYDINEPLKDLL